MSSIYTANVHMGASPTAGTVYVNDVQMGALPGRSVRVQQYSASPTGVTWGSNVWDWSATSFKSNWLWAIWKVTITGDPYPDGRLRVKVHTITADKAETVKLMQSSTLDATATPILTKDVTGSGAPVGCVTETIGGSIEVYQTGYFAIMAGWTGPWSLSAEITAMDWVVGAVIYPMWTQTYIGTSGVRLS